MQIGTAIPVIRQAAATLWSWMRSNYWTIIAAMVSALSLTILVYLARHDHRPPVGVYIAILGGIAAGATFRKEPPVHEKFFWIIAITAFMTAEIHNLYKDREEHNAQQLLISQSISTQGQTLTGMARNIQLSADLFRQRGQSSPQPRITSGHSKTIPPAREPIVVSMAPTYGNLRERALQLSQELYGLVSREQQQQQSFLALGPATASRTQEVSQMMVVRLSEDYFMQYDSQVRQIRDDFAKLNFRDRDLESTMHSIDEINALMVMGKIRPPWIVNGGMVLMVARGLTELASKVPSN